MEIVTEGEAELDADDELDVDGEPETVKEPLTESVEETVNETDALGDADAVVDFDEDVETVATGELVGRLILGGKHQRGANEIPRKVDKPLRVGNVSQRTRRALS